jgi:hypothetical protein
MDLEYYGRQKAARTFAANAGLRLVERDDISCPHTDARSLFVTRYNPDWEPWSEEFIKWWGSFYHEVAHNDKRNDNARSIEEAIRKMKLKLRKGKWMFVHNVVEDCRIEANEYGEYEGRDRIKTRAFQMNVNKYIETVRKLDPEVKRDPRMEALFLLLFHSCDIIYTKGMNDVFEVQSDEVLQLYNDKLSKYAKRVVSGINWEECHEITDEIYESLFDESDEEDEGREKGKGTAEEGEGDDDGESGEEGRASKSEGVDYEAWLEHKHDLEGKSEYTDKLSDAEVTFKYRYSGEGAYPGVEMVEVKTKTLSRGTGDDFISADKILEYARVDALANKIRRYLLVKTRNNEVNGQKNGRIDGGSLWKGVVYRNSQTGQRVFSKKQEHKTIDTAVTLLIDQSGSMRYSKFLFAAAAGIILNEVFAKIGVKCRVSSFTDEMTYTYTLLHKEFDEKVTANELAERISNGVSRHGMAGNADGENVLWEYGKLRARSEPKKILVVLSDGLPDDSKHMYDCEKYTKEVCDTIQKRGDVLLIGIGIMDNAVKRFYRRNRVINSAHEIVEVMLKILSEEVLHD